MGELFLTKLEAVVSDHRHFIQHPGRICW